MFLFLFVLEYIDLSMLSLNDCTYTLACSFIHVYLEFCSPFNSFYHTTSTKNNKCYSRFLSFFLSTVHASLGSAWIEIPGNIRGPEIIGLSPQTHVLLQDFKICESKSRNQLFAKYKTTGSDADGINFRRIRNNCKQAIRQFKRNSQTDLFSTRTATRYFSSIFTSED